MKKRTKTKPSRKSCRSAQPARVVFLLDRTGSMESVKQETITGFNGYLDSIKSTPNLSITLVQFDSVGIDKMCEGVPLDRCPRLNSDNYVPRAMTPLYDALGRTLTSTRESVKGEKVLFVILTDGQENASSEWTDIRVKELMKELEGKHQWTFAYIGMGPSGWNSMQTISSGLRSASNVLNITQDPKQVKRTYARMAGQTVAYASCVSDKSITNFWDSDSSSEKKA